MTDYLYLIWCNGTYYKIGIANDLRSRLAQLQTGNPYPLEVQYCFSFPNAAIVEKALHQKFAHCRKLGEWFELLTHDVTDFVTICRMLGGSDVTVRDEIVNEVEIEEAEEIAEPSDGARWDYAAMFSDGWRMERANTIGWRWRNTKPEKGTPLNSSQIFMYGGRVSDLPYPDIETMTRVYRDGLPA